MFSFFKKLFKKGVIKLADFLNASDEYFKVINTKIKIKCFKKGKLSQEIDTHNAIVYNERLNMHENLLGTTKNPDHHLTLNTILNIPHSVNLYESNAYRLKEVRYFCIGSGAESKTVKDSIIKERNSDTKLYNIVPFRCVPIGADLSEEEREKYRLRKIITIKEQQYIAYYAKACESFSFDNLYNGQIYVPDESHTSTLPDTDPKKPIKGAITLQSTYNLKVDAVDFKEYYRIMNENDLTGCKINELGLISACDVENGLDTNKKELAGAELATKVTFTNINLDVETAEAEFIYTINS